MFYDFEQSRGWVVQPAYDGDKQAYAVLEAMADHPQAPGHSDVGVRNLVYTTVLNLRPRRVLEIGCHIGSAAVVMGSALRKNGYGKLISLEPHAPYADLAEGHLREAGLSDYVQVVRGFSFDLRETLQAEAPFEVIFIDGAHDYHAALADIRLCADLLHDNGLVILHDTGRAGPGMDASGRGGVRKALYDFTRERSGITTTFYEHPLWLNSCGAATFCKQKFEPTI